MKYKNVPLPEQLFKRLMEERIRSGINANAIVIMALDEYLKKKEKERK